VPDTSYDPAVPTHDDESRSSHGPGLLSMKRAPPRLLRPFVPRPRLTDRLETCVTEHLVTLVLGPGGAGKTSLVAAWAAQRARPGRVAWLRLNGADDNRSAFWRQVVLALAETGASAPLDRLTVPSAAVIDDLLPELFLALDALDEPLVLVLDDLHEITDPQVMADLSLLLRSPPSGLRVVIIGRAVPPLHVARLRLAGVLGEIDGEELRFTLEESAQLLTALEVPLTPDEIEKVWDVAEGWAAGLALSAMALKGRGDVASTVDRLSGATGLISDYLLQEIFDEMLPGTREFLLSTSVLGAVCGDLADAVTTETGGAAMLYDLHDQGALIEAIDDKHTWYRYHGLLAGMLQAQLRREAPDLVPVLNQRAARWLAANGLPVRAVSKAILAGDLALVSQIVTEHATALHLTGELGDLAAALRHLPQHELHADPILALTVAGAAAETGDTAEATKWEQIAAVASRHAEPAVRARVDAGRTAVNLYLARLTGDVPRALKSIEPFTSTSTTTDSDWNLHALELVNLGALQAWLGDATSAIESLDEGVRVGLDHGQDYLAMAGLAHRSIAHGWRGEQTAAADDANRALTIADAHGWRQTALGATALVSLATHALVRGDLEESAKLVEETNHAVARGVEIPLRVLVGATRGRILRLRGDTQEAIGLFVALRAEHGESPFFAPVAEFVLAEEALARHAAGDRSTALRMLETALGERSRRSTAVTLARVLLSTDPDRSMVLADAHDHGGPDAHLASVEVNALLVSALAHDALGHPPRSAEALEAALTLVSETGVRGPFLDHGRALAPLLLAHQRNGSVHAALAGELTGLLRAAPVELLPCDDELSDRELAVLRYLPSMLSNREIAGELVVSVNTVKTHLKHIYLKLGAHGRRDAVVRAERAGLLGAPLPVRYPGSPRTSQRAG